MTEPFVCMECEEPRPPYRDGICRSCWNCIVDVGGELHQVLADALGECLKPSKEGR